MTTFIRAAAVAEIIGFANASAFLRERERLEEEEGFPLPMPTCQRPLIWRRAQVESWLEASGVPKIDHFSRSYIGNVILLEEAKRA